MYLDESEAEKVLKAGYIVRRTGKNRAGLAIGKVRAISIKRTR